MPNGTTPPEGNPSPFLSPEMVAYQLREMRKDLWNLHDWRREVDKERVEFKLAITALTEDMKALTDSFTGLRRMLMGLSLSIAGSSVIFALSILGATGKL